LIIDFSTAVGNVIMKNDAKTPYPDGDPVDPNLDGQIMKFQIAVSPNK
jgi:spore coat protein A